MTQKITTINIRTDGNPIAICPRDEFGNVNYGFISLVALAVPEEQTTQPRTYQASFVGVQPFSLRGLESPSQSQLEGSVNSLVDSKRKTREFSAINKGVPLQIYCNDNYYGLIFLGRNYDGRTRWDNSFRDMNIVGGEFLGDLRLRRYESSPLVKGDFQAMVEYLEARKKGKAGYLQRESRTSGSAETSPSGTSPSGLKIFNLEDAARKLISNGRERRAA